MISFLNETAIFQVAAKLFDDSSGSIDKDESKNNAVNINSSNNNNIIISHLPISTTLASYFDEIVKNGMLNSSTAFDSDLSYIEHVENSVTSIGFLERVIIGFLLLVLILFCVIGNFFVILAILLERDLRSRPQYYLIFSLAIADLLVGLVVTPLGAWAVVQQAWNLGVTLCDFWISVDVLVNLLLLIFTKNFLIELKN